MDKFLKNLASDDPKNISTALDKYAQEISSKFSFPELDSEDYRNKLFKAFHSILKDENLKTCHKLCLQVIRIISREKKDLNELITPELFDLILWHSGLKDGKDIRDVINHDIALEALMCLCNITFNATIPRQICCRNGTVESILNRLHTFKDGSPNINFFDMKILFIITALCENIRGPLKDEMHGLSYLIEYLETMMNELKESNHNADVRQEPNKLSQVLPPLRDIHTRPEQGDTIRNCLCRLLTSPITQVRDLAADFIFVLCKENVGRMIKYTGYGNAAGMFATRGLLNGENGETQNYSSASEDSETEEYNEYKHGINPVTGCYQEPKPSPTANMTEEQKEYEAMKLVELMDNLTRKGIVKPCRIGPDGKPEPIEHVLQLQEGLGMPQSNINDSDED
ncbi:synembryn [Holotrichia oblita]|uniref:Synembryn n=1 Tax=Holotrichia oblita TaxID=644536 RepID=A0ACB9TAG7_HOLOL|nr:synembryn [Holotrichia oblita]